MDLKVMYLLDHFGEALVNRKFDDANKLLASWVVKDIGPTGLREEIDEQLQTAAEEFGIEDGHPVGVELDENPSELEEVAEYAVRDLYPEITESNYRGWYCIQLTADESLDIEAWMDVWVVVAEEGGALRIGYYELAMPD